MKHVVDLALKFRQIVFLHRGDLLVTTLLCCVDGSKKTLDEDEHLYEEHLPEQVVFELQSKQREMREIFGILFQYLSIPLIDMLDRLLVEASQYLVDSSDYPAEV